MAMSAGYRRGEINVTPMIDVLLVLIIIFMVIQPQRSIGLDTSIPQPASPSAAPPTTDVTIAVRADGTIHMNQERVELTALDARLRELYKRAAELTVFIRADDQVDFAQVAEVIDTATGAGIKKVGLLPR